MSELKTFDSQRIYWAVEQVERVAGDIAESHLDDNLFYIKSEVDTFIAELKKEKEYVLVNTTDALNAQERELRIHKFKRCLTNAENCNNRGWYYFATHCERKARKMWDWRERWLDIAKTFQPNTYGG